MSTGILATSIEESFKTAGLQHEFQFIEKIKANRVQNEQLKVLHKLSGSSCLIEFNTKSRLNRVQQAAKIIQNYSDLHPMC